MSDRTQCTSPPASASDSAGAAGTTPPPPPSPPDDPPAREGWEREPAFRETFLVHLPPPVDDAARDLGAALYERVLDIEADPPPAPASKGAATKRSWVAARLGAMATDLRFGERYLESLARERFHSSLRERDARLAEEAEGWADDLRLLAEEIELALELPGGPTPV